MAGPALADWRWMLASVAAAGLCECFCGIIAGRRFRACRTSRSPSGDHPAVVFIGAFFNHFFPARPEAMSSGSSISCVTIRSIRRKGCSAWRWIVAGRAVLVIIGLVSAWTCDDWFAQSYAGGQS